MPKLDINPEFRQALELLDTRKQPIFITGCAGTGKSTLLQYFCSKKPDDIVVLAPTGVAALNVKGQTIHRFFRFKPSITRDQVRGSRNKPRNPNLYKSLSIIIIDEASMLRADLLDCMDAFLKKHGPVSGETFGGVQMVFIGDLYQLPPVVTSDEREIFTELYQSPYFFSAHCMSRMDLQIVELTQVYRQKDADFIELLSRIRNNNMEDRDLEQLNQRVIPNFDADAQSSAISLTTTNKAANQINSDKLDALPGRATESHAEIAGEFDRAAYPTDEKLCFKKGARIMLLNNDISDRWVNGTLGTVTDIKEIDGETVVSVKLADSEKTVQVRRHLWEVFRYKLQQQHIVSEPVGSFEQFPFRLAWAVTIHKSQGKTFDQIVLDMGSRGAFSSGQTYVALSRCTSLEGIVLTRPLKANSIRVDWRVAKFLTDYQYAKAEAKLPTEAKVKIIQKAIEQKRTIRMVYLKANDTRSKRDIVPIEVGTLDYQGKPFLGLSGMCSKRQDVRNFRVDRILELEVLSDV